MSGTNVDVWREVAKDQDSRGKALGPSTSTAAETESQPNHPVSLRTLNAKSSKPIRCLTRTLTPTDGSPTDPLNHPEVLGEDHTPSYQAEPAESPETKAAINLRGG